MANLTRLFVLGRMNKDIDERLIPDGEYIDALNVRVSSTNGSGVGVVTNALGNEQLATVQYNGSELSSQARCIGALAVDEIDTIFWMIHDPNHSSAPLLRLDMVVSYNTTNGLLRYHLISVRNGASGTSTTLNFDPNYLVTGMNYIDGMVFWVNGLQNPPRFINEDKDYGTPIGGVDSDFGESILVIKKPPLKAPTYTLFNAGGQENFMTERLICFGYRYRYEDGMYSATSPFSDVAFNPGLFEFSIDSFLNEGMINGFNAAIVDIQTGGPLVVGIDVLFKEAGNNIIKVIERLDKNKLGIADDSVYQYEFRNSKIFTVLPESEILRLYDNVPRYAFAQSFMGNRIVYGNYIERYDLNDSEGNPVRLDYVASLATEDVSLTTLDETFESGVDYTVDGTVSVSDSQVDIDLSSIANDLVEGAEISLEITFTHSEFSGTVTPADRNVTQSISFSFLFPRSYTSVFDLASSVEFIEAIGTLANIQTVANSCNGLKLTDTLNCSFSQELFLSNGSTITKYESGITANNQPIQITASPGSDSIKLKLVAIQYVDDVANPVDYAYEYFKYASVQASYAKVSSSKSLHSNRGYEVGIVYLDEYGRSTTALVSQLNTVHVPCENSPLINTVQVEIPTTQKPPSWASKYRFVMKSDRENYETIYSGLFFKETETNTGYLLLDGENSRKVEVGDRLIIKSDASGVRTECSYITVLEKESKESGFIDVEDVTIPAGVYIKVRANEIDLTSSDDDIIAPGRLVATKCNTPPSPILSYPIGRAYNGTDYEDYTVPAGSRITISLIIKRESGTGCGEIKFQVKKTFISANNYNSFKEWFEGDDIVDLLNDADVNLGPGAPMSIVYFPTLIPNPPTLPSSRDTFYMAFTDGGVSGQSYLAVSGTFACGSSCRNKSNVILKIEVFRAANTMVFETEPSDSVPDLFFENHETWDIVDGFHMGDIQDQTSSQPAIVNTGFFNCFSFGNGVESYKIRDSIVGKFFTLGNRATSVDAQDYKEANRFADITWSGVYNDESNVNKLNEFNLGLDNYKALEDSFGSIQILDGRRTDLLVLQSDRVSYVLAGKNLLSDAAAGGAIASVPEVFGTQIARAEEHGISYNPESFVKRGSEKYFTDSKRSAVIRLVGSGYSGESMEIISSKGLDSWFRDAFIANPNTQKLGGYDPFNGEYVLSGNETPIPIVEDCLDCGVGQTFRLDFSGDFQTYCVDLNNTIGQVDIDYDMLSLDSGVSISLDVSYNGSSAASTNISSVGSGTISFNKTLNNPEKAYVAIVSSGVGRAVISVTVKCPSAETVDVINIIITNDEDATETTHGEFYYVDGAYISPKNSQLVTFLSGAGMVVSEYYQISGPQGAGSIPTDTSTVYPQVNKLPGDTFTFDLSETNFYYLRSDVLYSNTPTDIASLISNGSTQAGTPVVVGNAIQAPFSMPATGDYLYLVWDLRKATQSTLCFSTVSAQWACCECKCNDLCNTYEIVTTGTATIEYTDCASGNLFYIDYTTGTDNLCSRTIPIVSSGTATITLLNCGC